MSVRASNASSSASLMSDQPSVEGRWSARRSLAFAVGSSATLWAVIIMSGAALIR